MICITSFHFKIRIWFKKLMLIIRPCMLSKHAPQRLLTLKAILRKYLQPRWVVCWRLTERLLKENVYVNADYIILMHRHVSENFSLFFSLLHFVNNFYIYKIKLFGILFCSVEKSWNKSYYIFIIYPFPLFWERVRDSLLYVCR